MYFSAVYKLMWLGHLLVVIFFSCQPQDSERLNYAERENMYYEVVDNDNSRYSQKIIQRVKSELATWDFALINNSQASKWPYYTKVQRSKEIPQDSIMFPHKTVHRLIPYEAIKKNDNVEFKLVLYYNRPLEDGSPNIKIEKYKANDKDEWTKIIDLGIEKFNANKYASEETLSMGILEHLLIYSWK